MTIEKAHITWTATSLGAAFDAYEIERNDSAAGWQRIAEITAEATADFDDYEGRRGVLASYRMRVRRTDMAVSAWTSTASVTPAVQKSRVQLVSNEDPTLNVELWLAAVDRVYGFPEQAVEWEMHGRDNVVVIRDLEDRGDDLSLEVLIDPDTASATPGRAAFQDVLDIARAPGLSYVAVLDSDGNRWLAAVLVDVGRRRNPRGVHSMVLRVRETTDTPSTPPA